MSPDAVLSTPSDGTAQRRGGRRIPERGRRPGQPVGPFDERDLRHIADQIVFRDYKLIAQSDMVVVFYDALVPSPGVISEMNYALQTGKRVYGVWLPASEPSPFFTRYCTRVFAPRTTCSRCSRNRRSPPPSAPRHPELSPHHRERHFHPERRTPRSAPGSSVILSAAKDLTDPSAVRTWATFRVTEGTQRDDGAGQTAGCSITRFRSSTCK